MRIEKRLVTTLVLGLAALGVTMGGGMEGCQPTMIPVGPVSFSKDIQPIFDARCVSCHSPGGMADQVMHLVPEHSYDALVPSDENHEGGMEGNGELLEGNGEHRDMDHGARVVPGDSANSYLYQKVSMDSPPEGGARMPFGGPPLSQSQIDLIKSWIDQGALNN